jgi:hypothetical protein
MPDALTFDRKNSKIGYIKENVVSCCWFCNCMKNITIYEDWVQLINFLKQPEITILDLSNKNFGKSSRDIDTSSVYCSLKKLSPKYYPESSTAK